MFHSYSILKVGVVCVYIFGIPFTYVIKRIDSKLISVCLINDYSLIADLYIFFYGGAECAPISRTKVKRLILNNFDYNYKKRLIEIIKRCN